MEKIYDNENVNTEYDQFDDPSDIESVKSIKEIADASVSTNNL